MVEAAFKPASSHLHSGVRTGAQGEHVGDPRHDRSLTCMTVLALAWLAIAGPAGGDWLVTRSGQRIETKGSWTVKDGRVLFRTTAGTLTTLPLAAVDAEASRTASSSPPPPSASPAQRPHGTVRLTDNDVSHVFPSEIVEDPPPDEPAPKAGGPKRHPKVIIYTTDWCPVCRTAKAYFASHRIVFTERDIDKDPAARTELAARLPGFGGVPVIDIDGTLLKGFSSARVGQLLGLPPEAPAKPSERSPNRN